MKTKRYYREWLRGAGWGVMLAFDTIYASSKCHAIASKPYGMYSYNESFEYVKKVKRKHSHLSDIELSKIYGEKEK